MQISIREELERLDFKLLNIMNRIDESENMPLKQEIFGALEKLRAIDRLLNGPRTHAPIEPARTQGEVDA